MSDRSDRKLRLSEDENREFAELDEKLPTEEEVQAATALARALDGASGDSLDRADDMGELAELFRTAERARASQGLADPLSAELRDSIVDQALGENPPIERRRPMLRLLVGAIAAVFALFVLGLIWKYGDLTSTRFTQDDLVTASVVSTYPAPTDNLFDGPFPEDQSPVERVDRIVQARTRGYFAALIDAQRQGDPPSSRSLTSAAFVLGVKKK